MSSVILALSAYLAGSLVTFCACRQRIEAWKEDAEHYRQVAADVSRQATIWQRMARHWWGQAVEGPTTEYASVDALLSSLSGERKP